MNAWLVHLNPILKVKANVVLRAMPTPGSTKERKARANRRLPNNVKTNGSGTDAGAVIIGEGLPRHTFLCDIGYLRVIFTLGLLLR